MALTSRNMKCALCGEGLGDRQLFATSGVWLPREHPLWRYCDAAMHWDCYGAWPERGHFARTHLDARADWSAGAPVLSSDEVIVTLWRREDDFEVRVLVGATAASERVPLGEWERWLNGIAGSADLHEVQRAALAMMLPLLRSELPTGEVIKERADGEPVRAAHARFEAARETREAEHGARHAAKTLRTDALTEALNADGLVCPHCDERRTDHRYCPPRRLPGESYFICSSCSRSFTAEDFDTE